MKRKLLALILGLTLLIGSLPVRAETVDCTCGGTDTHAQDCPLYSAPACTCEAPEGVHGEGCPLYEAPAEPICTCESADGVHGEGCPLYEAPAEPICTCESADGVHGEGCPLYAAPSEEPVSPPAETAAMPYCTCQAVDGVHESGCLRAYAIAVKPGDGDLEITMEMSAEKTLIFDGVLPVTVECDPVNSHFSYQDGVMTFKFPATVLAGTTYRVTAAYEDGHVFQVSFTAAEPAAPDPEPEFEAATKDGPIQGLENAALSAHGRFPVGSTLTLSAADPVAIAAQLRESGNETEADFIAGFANTAQPWVALDITLLDKSGAVTQPDGSVTLRLKADKLPTEGNEFLVYHIHEGQLSAAIEAKVDNEGYITFTLPDFSYVIVTDATANIENVAAYYEIATGGSGNGQWLVQGLYYDSSGKPHILMRSQDLNPGEPTVQKITVKMTADGSDAGIVTPNPKPVMYRPIRKLTLMEDGTEKKVLFQREQGEKAIWVADYELDPEVKIEEIFYLSVYINGNGDNNNGFNIANMPIQVQIGYDVQKTIHQLIAEDNTIEPIAGDSAAGEPGKTVVYKIVAQNKVSSTDPIKNAIIKDTLPDGLFDLSTVEVCDEYGKWASVEVNDDRSFTVGTVPNFEPGQKKEYYVKATIFEGEYEPSDAVYINTASLSGENAPIEKKDTANIIIGSPKGTADLTISKTVVGTNDARLIANSEFTFTIRSIVEGVYTTEFYDSLTATSPTKNTKQLDIGNSFKLKDGQRLVIKDLPVGSTVRIEEEQHPNFICTNRNQQCVILTSIETTKNSLTFVNNFTTDPIPPDPPDETETADLTITKSGAQGIDENQSFVFEVTGPGGYRQTVIIHGNGKAVIKDLPDGTYTVKEKKDWSWRYTPVQESVTLNFPEQSEAAFTNTRMNPGKWLNGSSYADNQWPTEPTAPAQ